MDERTQKQMYLKVNIMEAGYDANKFGMFMASQKVDGTEINNWSLVELQDLVLLFSQDESNSHKPGSNSPAGIILLYLSY
jgi:hypothetical protein